MKEQNSFGHDGRSGEHDQVEERPLLGSALTVISVSLLVVCALAMAIYASRLARGVAETKKALEAAACLNSSARTLEIDKTFIAHPEMRPYFDSNKTLRNGDKDHDLVVSVADQMLDSFDALLGQSEHFPSMKYRSEVNRMWNGFNESSVLRERLLERSDVYQDTVYRFFREWKSAKSSGFKKFSDWIVSPNAGKWKKYAGLGRQETEPMTLLMVKGEKRVIPADYVRHILVHEPALAQARIVSDFKVEIIATGEGRTRLSVWGGGKRNDYEIEVSAE